MRPFLTLQRCIRVGIMSMCFVTVASAQNSVVSSLTIRNNTGGVRLLAPTAGTLGTLTLPAGSGTLIASDVSGNLTLAPSSYLQLIEPVGAGGVNYIRLQAGDMTANAAWTLPRDGATAGDVLTVTSVAGDNVNLEWAPPPAGGGGGGGGGANEYGDGSAGDIVVAAGATVDVSNAVNGWEALVAGANPMFRNITINGTLIVPSGTVLRASGTITVENTGTITVTTGTNSAAGGGEKGLSARAAGASDQNGLALSAAAAQRLFRTPNTLTGGSGQRGTTSTGAPGNAGGSILLVAQGAIAIRGTVQANGESGTNGAGTTRQMGSGGGAGGLVVVASNTTVTVAGTISANGGNGSDGRAAVPPGTSDESGGGGGGGGIIHLLAPVAPVVTGTLVANGGTRGADVVSALTNQSSSGAGGGFGGNGGVGALSGTKGAVGDQADGSVGRIFTTVIPRPSLLVLTQ